MSDQDFPSQLIDLSHEQEDAKKASFQFLTLRIKKVKIIKIQKYLLIVFILLTDNYNNLMVMSYYCNGQLSMFQLPIAAGSEIIKCKNHQQ